MIQLVLAMKFFQQLYLGDLGQNQSLPPFLHCQVQQYSIDLLFFSRTDAAQDLGWLMMVRRLECRYPGMSPSEHLPREAQKRL